MRRNLGLWCVALLSVLVSACSSTEYAVETGKSVNGRSERVTDDRTSYKVGSPYVIGGVTYRPSESFDLVETGEASWYGPKFDGRRTANGEIFDMYAMTAAHRTLQLPSIIRVTNLRNGRSVIVRVNDRGPYAGGRILDLSKAAAASLGFQREGVTDVRIEVMPAESRRVALLARSGISPESQNQFVADLSAGKTRTTQVAEAATGTDERFYLQAGAFAIQENAERLSSRLSNHGSARVVAIQLNDQVWYRVRLGPFADRDAAESILQRVRRDGAPTARVMRLS